MPGSPAGRSSDCGYVSAGENGEYAAAEEEEEEEEEAEAEEAEEARSAAVMLPWLPHSTSMPRTWGRQLRAEDEEVGGARYSALTF